LKYVEAIAMQPTPFQDLIERINATLAPIKHIVAVLSGKGGVGKSLVASSIAICASLSGKKVAIFDADIHGPSIPWIIGVENMFVTMTLEGKIKPVERDSLAILSIELLLDKKASPVIWRGPLKARTILDLLSRTDWGERDLLVIDLPPGTGDEALTIAQFLKNHIDGALLVLTPGLMVSHIVTKAREFLKLLGIPLLGTVINMAYFRCPNCGSIHYILGSYPGDEASEVIAEIPIDPELAKVVENGQLYDFLRTSNRESAQKLRELTRVVLSRLGVQS